MKETESRRIKRMVDEMFDNFDNKERKFEINDTLWNLYAQEGRTQPSEPSTIEPKTFVCSLEAEERIKKSPAARRQLVGRLIGRLGFGAGLLIMFGSVAYEAYTKDLPEGEVLEIELTNERYEKLANTVFSMLDSLNSRIHEIDDFLGIPDYNHIQQGAVDGVPPNPLSNKPNR